jgi:RHS repeat-associated protein
MLDDTRAHLPAGYPTDTTTNPNQYVAELYSNGNNTVIGPGIVMKVMAGDQFSVRAESWYQLNGTTPGTPLNPLTDVVTALIAGVAAAPGEGTTAAALQANSAPLSPNVMQFLADTGASIIDTKPHAFLNWVLFDNQFNYVSASSGFQQVGANGVLTPMILTNLPITSSGYLYIYTSNATANVPVFFDNLQVTHTRGPLLEEDYYYPFGLGMAGISDEAVKTNYVANKYRFIGQLYDDDLDWDAYQMRYRTMDPQLGRFWQVDPLATKYVYTSPFAYAENRPIDGIDLEGKEWWRAVGGILLNDPVQTGVGIAGMHTSLKNDAEGAMQSNYRLATNTSGQADSHSPSQIQGVINTADKLQDIVSTAQPAIDVLQMINTLAALTPVGEAGAAASVGGEVMKLAAGADAQVPLSEMGAQIQQILNLNQDLTNSFSGGQYYMVEAQQDMQVARVYGGTSGQEGSFFGLAKPISSKEAESMYYLNAYGNNATQMTTVTIKKGTQFAVGGVANGTGTQIFLPTYLQQNNAIYSAISQILR